jgi:hypothetical protein
MFRQAVRDNLEDEIRALPTEAELSKTITFSERHVAYMKRLFALDARRERMIETMKWSRRLAAAVVIAVTILFGALLSSPDVRAAVTRTIIRWFEQLALFTSADTVQPGERMEPAYLPSGFVEVQRMETEVMTVIVYMNDAGEIIDCTVLPVFHDTASDIEQREYELLMLDGISYHILLANNDVSTLLWETHGNRYTINAELPIEVLLEIARSVR